MIKMRVCLLAIAVVSVLLVLSIVLLFAYRHFDRISWRNHAIAEIVAFTDDKAKIISKLSKLESNLKPDESQNYGEAWWCSDNLILMKSGEWLAYRSSCCHDSPLLSDRFIAKASNGKWYYSTYHFCKGMMGLLMDLQKQPKNLALFVKAFNLKEFDGSSNACLDYTAFSPDGNALMELNQ